MNFGNVAPFAISRMIAALRVSVGRALLGRLAVDRHSE
jgi:hypothetical protein